MNMIRFFFLLVTGTFLACSAEKDYGTFRDLPESVMCCTQQSIQSIDSIMSNDSITNQTRVGNQLTSISLLSFGFDRNTINSVDIDDYNSLAFPIHNEYGNIFTDICFRTDFSLISLGKLVVIKAINENGNTVELSYPIQDVVNVFRSRSCYFSSVGTNKVSLQESSITTPKGKPTYSSLSNPVYVSNEYRFGYNVMESCLFYQPRIGGFLSSIINITPDRPIKLSLSDSRSLLKARILLTEMDHEDDMFDQVTYELLRDRFVDLLGNIEDWKVAVFLDGIPVEFPIVPTSKLAQGSNIMALCDQTDLKSGKTHKQYKNFKTYNYLGIGISSPAEGYVLPFNTSESYLKYSFYYTGKRNFKHKQVTLRVPISDLDSYTEIDRSCIYNITTIIDVRDLRDAVRGRYPLSRQNANYQISEDEEYGLVIDLPCVTDLNKNKKLPLR